MRVDAKKLLVLLWLPLLFYLWARSSPRSEGIPPSDPKKSLEISRTELSYETSYNHSYADSFAILMRERRELVQAVCEKLYQKKSKLLSYHRETKNFKLVKSRKIVYCPVFKASSANWRWNLLDLLDIPEIKKQHLLTQYHNNLDKVETFAQSQVQSSRKYSELLSESQGHPEGLLSFIIVRHPFERIVSAFRDKLEQYHTEDYTESFYYRTYGKKIVRQFREASLARFGPEYFSESSHFGAPFARERRVANLPIFWEFVQYLKKLSPSSMDEHWRPISLYCSICQVDFQAVVKHESLAEEEGALKAWLGADHLPKRRMHVHAESQTSSAEMTRIYFDTLTEDDVRGLYEIYKADFLLFNYTFSFGSLVLPTEEN